MTRPVFAALLVAVLATSVTLCLAQNPSATTKADGGQVTVHELAPLPYAYNALEPYYDEQTVRIHHDAHQAAYVKGLNNAEQRLVEARASGDYALIQYWERQLAFHGSGDTLHTIFFRNMAPDAGGEPSGAMAERIRRDFGSFAAFRAQFTQAAISVEGSGWAVLGWSPEYEKLYIVQIENHQKQTVMGLRPLLVLDVWEHAYYLKHRNKRADWVEDWWRLVNWPDVASRFAQASR